MNEPIKQMITKDVQLVKMIIECKGQIGQKTHVLELPDLINTAKTFTQMLDQRVLDNDNGIIKNKGSMENLGVQDKPKKKNTADLDQGPLHRGHCHPPIWNISTLC